MRIPSTDAALIGFHAKKHVTGSNFVGTKMKWKLKLKIKVEDEDIEKAPIGIDTT